MSTYFVEMHSVLMDTEKRVEGATSNYSYLVTPRGQDRDFHCISLFCWLHCKKNALLLDFFKNNSTN